MILVNRPNLPNLKEYLSYLKRIWATRWLSNNSEFVCRLEEKLKSRFKTPNVMLTANGTLALQLVIKAFKLKGEVITTPFTFPATTNAIVWEGLKPVFADINEETFNLDPRSVEEKITKKTSAILAVHIFGNPCYPEELSRIAQKHHLKLIFDAAQAFDVKYKNRSLLHYGDASILSFHATKVFHTIEGGAAVVKNRKIAERLRLLRFFGLRREQVVYPGINAKMHELEAAMGLSNLKIINKVIADRKKLYELYHRLLQGINGVQFQKISASRYNYAYFPVIFKNKNIRDFFHKTLSKNKIETRKYFSPLTAKSLFFKKQPFLPVAGKIADRILCLPLYSDLPLKTIFSISGLIKKSLQ